MSEHTPSTADIAGELSSWMAAGGILTMMLFPFALPVILLLVVSALPLVVLPLAVAMVAAVVAVPLLLARVLVRWAVSAMRPGSCSERGAAPAHQEA